MRPLLTAWSVLAGATLLGAGLLFSGPAQAGEPQAQAKGFYATVGLGATGPLPQQGSDPTSSYNFTDNYTAGFSGEVGVGYDFGPMRTELTYSYDNSQLSDYTDPSGTYGYQGGQKSANSVLVSAYWDIDTHSRWTPYLGGGLGYGWQNQAGSSDASASYNGYGVGGLAWQAKAGLGYALSRQADLFAEFVYRGLGGFTATVGATPYDYSSLNRLGFQLGGRWRFGN